MKKSKLPFIRPEVAIKLGYYVYAYIDPSNKEIFYVGKGRGARVLAHLSEVGESVKNKRIAKIKARGLTPEIDIIAHCLPNEQTAFRVEAALIDCLKLSNIIRGFKASEMGRTSLQELQFQYAAKPVKINEPALLIRINTTYRPGMTAFELYEATRGIWVCGKRRENIKYAFAVYHGVIREVYELKKWEPGNPKSYKTRQFGSKVLNRWQFCGKVSKVLSEKYRGASVADYFPDAARNPLRYLNC